MTSVLIGAMLVGLSGTAVVPMLPLAAVVLFLPIREFLLRPDRDIKRYGLKMAGKRFPVLQESIRLRSEQVDLKYFPCLLISENREEIYEMGSFSRWYIVMGIEKAQIFEKLLNDPQNYNLAEVQIFHELYHFKTGDYWQLGYLAELFKVSFNLMFWALLFFGAWGFMLVLAKDSFFQFFQTDMVQKFPVDFRPIMEQIIPVVFPSPTEIDALRIRVENINLLSAIEFVFNITWPYILLTGILWLFYRPLLWRVREFYADAGIVQQQGGVSYFWDFVVGFNQIASDKGSPDTDTRKNIFQTLLAYVQRKQQEIFWPSFSQRVAAIEFPERIYYTWKQIALFVGFLVLFLEIFLATPISLPLVGQNPMTFTTIVVVVSLAYFLLPQIALGKDVWKDGLRILFVIFGIRTFWLLLTIGLMWVLYFVQPDLLMSTLMSAITSTARYSGADIAKIKLPDFLIEATFLNSLQVPIVLCVQVVSSLGLLFLFKRILLWHSFINNSQRLKFTIFGLTFVVSFFLFALIMPLSMAVLKSDFSALGGFSGGLAVLSILIIISGGIWFYIQDRKYYRKCPSCNAESDFDKKCKSCGATLNPWLWVEYADE